MTNTHNSAKRVAKNTGFLYIRMGITVFVSLYVTRLVLGTLGAEDFGIYSLVAGMVSMLVFLNAAMTAATQRFMSYAQGERNLAKQKKIFNVSILLHFIIAIAVALLMELVGYFLLEGVLDIPIDRIAAAKLIFHFMVVSTFFTIISVPYDAVVNAHENMFFVAITGVLESFLKLAVAIYITYADYDKLIIFGLLMAAIAILMLIIKQVYCYKNYDEVKINFNKYFDLPLLKEMGSFASWSFLTSSTSMLSFYGQGIVLNIFFGPIVNAAQAISAQVSGQLSAFSTTMLKALNPLLAKSEGGGDRALMLNASIFGSKISSFLLMLFFIPVIVEMPYIFSLWLTDVPEFTIIFCRLLLVKNLIEQLFLTLNSSILAVGNIKKYQIWKSLFQLIPLPICYLLFLNDFPAYTLYIIFIFQSVIIGTVTLYFCKEYCDLSISDFIVNVVLRCMMTFILILGLTICCSVFFTDDFYRLILVLMTSFILFLFTVWFVGFNKKERATNRMFLSSYFSKT
jgi:O-antigen/teichoic acid export membrane protein